MLEHIDAPLSEFLSYERANLLNPGSSSIQTDIANCATFITSILQLLGSVLKKYLSRDSTDKNQRKESVTNLSEVESVTGRVAVSKDNEEIKFISNTFAFVFVWAVSGRLHQRFVIFQTVIPYDNFVAIHLWSDF